MEKVLLQYNGKKAPFKTPPMFGKPVTFGSDPVWVNSAMADSLMKVNPSMFTKLRAEDPENPIEDADKIVPKAELEVPEIKLTCENCGKEYKNEGHFANHIKNCKRE